MPRSFLESRSNPQNASEFSESPIVSKKDRL